MIMYKDEWFNTVNNGPDETDKALDALFPKWWQRLLRWRPWPRKQRIISSPENEAPDNPFPPLAEQEAAYRELSEIYARARRDGIEAFTKGDISRFAELLVRFNGVPEEHATEEAILRVRAIFKLTEQKYGR